MIAGRKAGFRSLGDTTADTTTPPQRNKILHRREDSEVLQDISGEL
jgi:hypothetical protein